MYSATHISPIVPSEDIAHTRDFLISVLEYAVVMDDPQYVIVERDGQTLHICPAGEDAGQSSFYVEVEGIDALWVSVKDKLEELHVKELFTQPYGMREFHVVLPATQALMFVGEKT